MGSVFLKRTVSSCRLLHFLLRVSCASSRANSVTWNPHKMMGVLLQCSAILVKEKVCTPSRDELVACTGSEGEKSTGSFSQYLLLYSQDCPIGTTVAVLSCPYLLAFSNFMPPLGSCSLLPFFLFQCSGPCQ